MSFPYVKMSHCFVDNNPTYISYIWVHQTQKKRKDLKYYATMDILNLEIPLNVIYFKYSGEKDVKVKIIIVLIIPN